LRAQPGGRLHTTTREKESAMNLRSRTVWRAACLAAAVLLAVAAGLWTATRFIRGATLDKEKAGLWTADKFVRGATVDKEQEKEEAWYAPIEDDFRIEYNQDESNRKLQTWEQYWGWVQTFYAGNALSTGWKRQAREGASVIKAKSTRNEFIRILNEQGKLIAKEWAKDRNIRKISTMDLLRWNGLIVRAERTEDGTGNIARSILQDLGAQIAQKLGR
jgi:hypothetical protein